MWQPLQGKFTPTLIDRRGPNDELWSSAMEVALGQVFSGVFSVSDLGNMVQQIN